MTDLRQRQEDHLAEAERSLDYDDQLWAAKRRTLLAEVYGVAKHYGPGAHPGTGTPQSIHGRGGGGAGGPIDRDTDIVVQAVLGNERVVIPDHFRFVVMDDKGRVANDLDRNFDHSNTPADVALSEMVELGDYQARLYAEREAIRVETIKYNPYDPAERDAHAQLIKQRDMYSKEILATDHELKIRADAALPAVLERGAEVRQNLIEALDNVEAPTVQAPHKNVMRGWSVPDMAEYVKNGGDESNPDSYIMDPRPDLAPKADKLVELWEKSEAQYAAIKERSEHWHTFQDTYFPERDDPRAVDLVAVPRSLIDENGWLTVAPTDLSPTDIHAVQFIAPHQEEGEMSWDYSTRQREAIAAFKAERDPDNIFAYLRRDQAFYAQAESQEKARKAMKRTDNQVKKLKDELISDISSAASNIQAERDALQTVLSSYRDFGGELTLANKVKSKGVLLVRDVEPYLPADWIRQSNEHTIKLEVKLKSGNRAHYNGGLVQLDGTSDTTFHELGHHFETVNPVVKRLQYAYWAQRSGDIASNPVPISDVAPDYSHYARSEVTYPDAWANVYSGKYYDNSHHYEVVSMGMGGYSSLAQNLKLIRDGASYGWAGAASNKGSGLTSGGSTLPTSTLTGNTHYLDTEHMDFMLGLLTNA